MGRLVDGYVVDGWVGELVGVGGGMDKSVGVSWIDGRYLDIDKLAERDRDGYTRDSHRQRTDRRIDRHADR